MSVGLKEPEYILPVAGVQLAATSCGIKPNQELDLALLTFSEGTHCAATFTRNAFCAAPVFVARDHLRTHAPRALLINSGNANAGTGEQGIKDARQSCQWLAETIGCKPVEVLPFSTGVVGDSMQMELINKGIQQCVSSLSSDNWMAVARGIMTTDTIAKAISKQITINGELITITGIAKGSGMMCPNMATMLAFIVTDATVAAGFLQTCLEQAVKQSFNSITVDGDTSTNDACILAATAKVAGDELNTNSNGSVAFQEAISAVCLHLAQAIVRDGEGASKFVTIKINSAASVEEARAVAYTIAHSPLVKTALFASDPNWGRILAAVGRAGINELVIDRVAIYLDDVCIVSQGERHAAYTEAAGQSVMDKEEITIRVELGRGDAGTTIWTTDLSHEYVKINSEYRT